VEAVPEIPVRRRLPVFATGAVIGGLLYFFLGPDHPTTLGALCLLLVILAILYSTRER
jgi:hypothetical protein